MALPASCCLQVDPSARPDAHPAPPGRRCDLIEARHVGLIAVLSATPAGAHLSWRPSTTRGVMTTPPPPGFVQLQRWAERLGQVDRFGVEGTGSFAAGLTRWLQQRGYHVLEVTR